MEKSYHLWWEYSGGNVVHGPYVPISSGNGAAALTFALPHQVVIREVAGGQVGISTDAGSEQARVEVIQPTAPQDVDEQNVGVYLDVQNDERSVTVE